MRRDCPPAEIQKLCDLHVQIFKESLDKADSPESTPGHPLHTLLQENKALRAILAETRHLLNRLENARSQTEIEGSRSELAKLLDELSEIDKHYLRKENQLFPVLESKGVYGPPQVMWGIHDEVRSLLKEAKALFPEDLLASVQTTRRLVEKLEDMAYKEEKILFPMTLELFAEQDWERVRSGEEEIGYSWIGIATSVKAPPVAKGAIPKLMKTETQEIALETGSLSVEQIGLLLNSLPLDVTFVDEEDRVRFYSRGEKRIFPRTPAVIGRKVQNCHPPKSVAIVNKIIDGFRRGTKDVAEFWINLKGRLVHIRYFAVRDGKGKYKGVLEVVQDITDIQRLEGEKRLLDWME